MILNILNEDTRTQLISRAKSADKEKGDGKSRYEKRLKSKVLNTTREMNNINMNDLFKNNLLTVDIPVRGETDNYHVKLKFSGILDSIQKRVQANNDTLELRNIIQAITDCFNRNDVYIFCSCPDWKYRLSAWATINQITSGTPETRPSNITNPNDTLGPGCKHVMLVLGNQMWIVVLARVIYNYATYMESHSQSMYSTYIYPALHGHPYEEPVQMDMFDSDELATDADTIKAANDERRTSTQFKPGNQSGVQFAPEPKEDEKQLELTDLMGYNKQ